MDFYEVLKQVLVLLQRHGRLSYRALKLQFQLDDEYLDTLKEELIDVQKVAVDQDGRMLILSDDANASSERDQAVPILEVVALPSGDQKQEPLSYTPQYLAEKILTTRSALEDERKQVTVMFADIKDSTELIRDLDPEAAQQLLDPAIHIMMDAVHRFEGTVNQVLGDGIMAIFGAPIAHMHQAEALAEALNDDQRLGQIYTYMASYFWMTGDLQGAVTYSRNSLVLAKTPSDVKLQVMANYRLGQSYFLLGEHRRAIDCLRDNVTALEGELRYVRFGMTGLPSVFSATVLVYCLAECGEFAEGTTRGEDAMQIAVAVDEPFSLVRAYEALGRLALRRGDLQQAISLIEQSLDLCRVWNFPVLVPNYTSSLAYCYALSGQLATALPLVEQVLEQGTSSNRLMGESFVMVLGAEVYLLAGRPEEARAYTDRALQLARERKEGGSQAYALQLLGSIAAHDDPSDVESANTYYQQALALATELGMRPLQAHCHRGLGTLYRQTGEMEQAHAELSTAIDMYRDMEMTFWLPETEAALAEVEGRT